MDFVVAVPKKNLPAYKKMAQQAGKVWLEHGALEFNECVADDVKVGKWTSFPQAVKLKPGEVVVFSYIVYKSRAARDKINKKVMADPRLERHDGWQGHALRRQAHDLWRLRDAGDARRLIAPLGSRHLHRYSPGKS